MNGVSMLSSPTGRGAPMSLIYRHAGWRVAILGTALVGLAWIPAWLAVTRGAAVRAELAVAATPAEPPPTFAALVRHPIVVRALAGVAAAAPVFSFPQVWGAKYLARTFAVAQADVGHYLWLPPLVLDAVAIAFGDLAARQRRAAGAPPRLLLAIAAALAAGIAAVPAATSPWTAVVLLAAASAGAGAMYALITGDMLARLPAGGLSLASGILAGAQSLALIATSPLVGRAVDRLGDYTAVSVALGGWVVPGAALWLAWRPPAWAAATSGSRR